jgi:hypothetical protein
MRSGVLVVDELFQMTPKSKEGGGGLEGGRPEGVGRGGGGGGGGEFS